jgi:DNA-binding SARP family transcriptional activator
VRTPSKVTAPRLPHVLERRRLFKLLDRARRSRVVWVVGPAGAGKTTLIASYAVARNVSTCWYRVDASDVDVATLFHCLGESRALSRTARLPAPPEPLAPALEVFSRRYFEALGDALPEPALLVFDNVHEVGAAAALFSALAEGLQALPEQVRVILVSREEPPAAFVSLSVRGELEVVDWSALRFTRGESARLIRARRRAGPLGRAASAARRPVPGALESLYRLSGGWAAALVLLTESASQLPNGSAALGDLSAEPARMRRVFDYLAAEIFERLDARTQKLLLATAPVSKFESALASELSGLDGVPRILGMLHEQGFFVERRGTNRAVYEYHPLFAAFLLERAHAVLGASEVVALRRRAASWLNEHGDPEAALTLLDVHQDRDAFVETLLRYAPALARHGRSKTLAGWLERLEESDRARNGWLLYWDAACRLAVAPGDALPGFERAFERLLADGDGIGAHLAWVGGVTAMFLDGQPFDRLDAWAARFSELGASGQLPEVSELPPPVQLAVTTSMLTALTLRRPAAPKLGEWAERAIELCRRTDVQGQHAALGLLTNHFVLSGQASKSEAMLALLKQRVTAGSADPLGELTLAIGEASLALASLDLDRVFAATDRALALADWSGVHVWDWLLAACAACSAMLLGDRERAIGPVERLARVAASGGPCPRAYHAFYRAWDAVERGDFPQAVEFSRQSREYADEIAFPFGQAIGRVACAMAEHGAGLASEARASLDQATNIAREIECPPVIQTCHLLEAMIALESEADGAGGHARAEHALREAFSDATRLGFFSTYMLDRRRFSRLCEFALERGVERDYVRAWVRRLNLPPSRTALLVEDWPFPARIRVLGSLRVEHGDTPIVLRGKVQQTPLRLLKALIARGGREVPQVELAAAVWPDAEGDAAQRNLETTLHRLRRWLGETDLIVVGGGYVGLDRNCWVDVHAFERVCERIERGDADRARWQELLLKIYRGSFLDGEEELFAVSERERLRSRFVRAVLKLGAAHEKARQPERAAALYERALGVEDLAEPLYAALIRSHQAARDPSQARMAYERCRRVLTSVLGAEPSAELRALAGQS